MKREMENPAESHLVYQLDDNVRITPLTIQEILNRSSKTNRHKGLKKAFDLLQNVRSFKNQPEDATLKTAIIQELQTPKTSDQSTQPDPNPFEAYKFDINKLHLMNKAGGIGMIERKCKFNEKGVLEFEEGKKQPKLKQIKGFNNLVEKFKDKANLSKLEWVKQTAKYPFRIVLIDKNKADKAVYFQTPAQAAAVQVYLIQKYKAKQQSKSLNDIFAQKFQQKETQMVLSFLSKVKPYASHKKSLRKSIDKSRQKTNINMVEANSSRQNTKYDKQISVLKKNRESNTLSQYYFNDPRGSNQILIDDARTEVNFKKTNKLFESSMNNKPRLFPQFNVRKVSQQLSDYNEFNIVMFMKAWKVKIANLTAKNNEPNKMRQSNVSRSLGNTLNALYASSAVQQALLEQPLVNTIRFSSFQLAVNPIVPFKPYVSINVSNKKHRNELMKKNQLKFNTFQTISLKKDSTGTIHYELIHDEDNEEGSQQVENPDQVLITANRSNHVIGLTLLNLLTGEVLAQSEISLDCMKVEGEKFSLQFNEISPHEQQKNPVSSAQNFPKITLTGTIQSKNPQPNFKGIFDYLFLNTQFLSTTSNHQLNTQNPANLGPNDNQVQNKNLITLIPDLEAQLKLKLNQIVQKRNYHPLDQSSYLPIPNLKDLNPSQQELALLSICAQFLKNTSIPSVSYTYLLILRMLIQSCVFQSQTQLLESFMAIIMKWTPSMFACSNDELNLAKVIGFQDDQIDKISQKITVSLQLIQFLLSQESPSLVDKMNRRNIPLNYLCLEYCHNMLAKNFPSNCALFILTFIFNSYDKSHQILMILGTVYICKFHEEELINCYKLEQVQFVLENSLKTASNAPNILIGSSLQKEVEKFILQKWSQYFSTESREKYEPDFEKIRSRFYQKQGEQLRVKKQRRFVEKCSLMERFVQINTFSVIKAPVYRPKSHCLHIYFVQVPKISGSLYLKTSLTEFQCVDYEKNPYFVISNLDSKVQLEFIDSKSNHYTCDLIFDAGFGFFRHDLNETNDSKVLRFEYWAGLFEESSIDYQYKNFKDIESSLSSELTIKDLQYRLNIDFEDSKLMRAIEKVCLNNSKSDSSLQELSRKIKTAFSQFQNKVNEYDLFLYLMAQRKVTLEEKLHTLFQFAKAIEEQLFLSQNSCLDRIVFFDFLRLMEIPITHREFEAFYQGILSKYTETYVPKVFKARFFFMYEEQREVKLQNELYSYIYQRAQKFVYTDIDLKEFLLYIKPKILAQVQLIQRQVGRKIKLEEGQLKLVLSSEGQVQHYLFKVSIKNNNRQFTVEDEYLPQVPYQQKLAKTVPKVLYYHKRPETEIEDQNNGSGLKLVSRSQPSNIMKSYTLAESRINILMSQKNINSKESGSSEFQRTNLCKFIMDRNKTIIRFRYKTYPKQVNFKNFNLLADLKLMLFGIKQNHELHSVKQLYFNNRKAITLEFLNDFQTHFKFGVSQNSQLYDYRAEIGLANNLQFLKEKNPKLARVYFHTNEERIKGQLTCKVLINHGFGVIRWETAILQGYFRVRNDEKKKKPKEMYLIEVSNRTLLTEAKNLKVLSLEEVKFLGEITAKALSKMGITKI